jgi:hypothetical protein
MRSGSWIVLEHITEDDSLFSSITKINGVKVTFEENSKGKIIGVDNIRGKSFPSIENVFLMNNLKHNLLVSLFPQ